MNFPNLEALVDGRVSGNVTEWPQLRVEAKNVLARIAKLEAKLRASVAGVEEAKYERERTARVVNTNLELEAHLVAVVGAAWVAVENAFLCGNDTLEIHNLRDALAALEQP